LADDIAHGLLEAIPDLRDNKGMCVGIYDGRGDAISCVPLDMLH